MFGNAVAGFSTPFIQKLPSNSLLQPHSSHPHREPELLNRKP
jgi:hypothetical protein